jgi:rod shape determining protein RodA
MSIVTRFKKMFGDPVLAALVLGLSLFGAAMVYSAGQLDTPDYAAQGAWVKQLVWLGISLVALLLVLRLEVRFMEWAAVPLYALSLIALLATLIVGQGRGTAAGVKSWLILGPVQVQPSQFAGIATILMLGRSLGAWREPPKSLWQAWRPIAIVAAPMMLVLAQPDLGTALVFGAVLIATLFWAGTPLGLMFMMLSPMFALFLAMSNWMFAVYMIAITAFLIWYQVSLSEGAVVWLGNLAAGTVAAPLWNSLEPYQKNRLLVFLDPNIDPRGAGYHVIQSKVAIGSGGLFGKGYTLGSQKRLAFLPEQHTDFIFSVIGEELGFIGTAAVLVVFGLILWRLARIAERVPDPFAGIVVFGIFGAWFAHIIVNVGMTVGVMPVTGIPLPFLSYGGSFLVATFLALGIAQRVASEQGKIY